MNVEVLGYVIIPVAIFIIGLAVASIRGAIRFAQYLVRSEEAQERTADSTGEISARLGAFIEKTEARLTEHGERLRVVEWEIDHNHGRNHAARKPAPQSD